MVEPALTPATAPEFDDIQGLVRFGHGRLIEACFHLLKIADVADARTWLASAPVTTAVERRPPPSTALQIAFTRQGLERLGVSSDVLAQFSPEFLSGMHEPSRSRRLGDVGANRPEAWDWGAGDDTLPDLVVMLYARQDGLAAWEAEVMAEPWATAFHRIDRLPTLDIGEIEPFGFPDGVSQPRLDWQQALPFEKERLAYRNDLALGEVLLGYPNEYGLTTDRPLLNPREDARAAMLPPALDVPERHDLGRNGSYLVFRQLHQDVRGFWQFMDRTTRGDPQRRVELAEAMVGRRMTGEPLVSPSDAPIQGIEGSVTQVAHNRFTYTDDPDGTGCPLGAHIRRANPRTADLPGGPQGLVSRLLRTLGFTRAGFREDLVAPSRFHRLLRRGREYGTELTMDEALQPGTDEPRGIHFICLVGNISRQFEFVQNAWMMSAKFDGLTDEADPILGNRIPLRSGIATDRFSIPRPDAPPDRVSGIPQFVTVRGGAYFFLPGIRALRYIAGAPA